MPADIQTRWTDDRIQALVTPHFILEQFKSDQRDRLKRPIGQADTASDHTYLGWVLERAKRLFLVLEHIGAPEGIFKAVEQSLDDDSLPLTTQGIKNLKLFVNLDPSTDKKFYSAQFIYLVRDIREGDHKRYLDDEVVPIKVISAASAIHRSARDAIEKIHVSPSTNKVYGRKKIGLNEPPSHLTEADVLAEIKFAKRLAHEHVLSIFGSYSHRNCVYAVLRPASEHTLSSFANSTPRSFDNLPKPQRREILLNWPHCLANGLAWLHANHRSHGALRPSNVLIDGEYQIYLGQIDGLTITLGNEKVSDIESYQYAAPERWKRAATVQKKTPVYVPNGRSVRKQSIADFAAASSTDGDRDEYGAASPEGSMNISKPTNTAYPFIPTSRGGNARHHKRTNSSEYAGSIRSSNSSGTGHRGGIDSLRISSVSDSQSKSRSGVSNSGSRSVLSSHGSGNRQIPGANANSVAVAPNEVRTTVVQTWQSAQFDPYAADIFALGAIIVDIMTFLCKRSASAFTKHRSSKNRTAGRGGGAADASFHSNLGQVHAWTVSLEEDARKKTSRSEGKIFEAVPMMLQIGRDCLTRTPEDRPEADIVEKNLEKVVRQFASSAMAHCNVQSPAWIQRGVAGEGSRSGLTRNASTATARPHGSGKAPMLSEPGRSTDNRTDYRASSSLAKFNFDYERSEDDRSYPPSTTSAGFSSEEILALKTISGRSGRPGDWTHLRSNVRDSFVSQDTQAMSMTEEEEMDLMNDYFNPRSGPPSLLPGPPGSAGSGRTPPSRPSPVTSNTARKRTDPEASKSSRSERSRQGDSAKGKAIQETDHGYIRSERSRDQLRNGPSSDFGASVKDDGNVSPVEDDEDTGKRGRRSVSTLASTSSTIRMSWQQRDVSPMSLGDTNTRASTTTSNTSFLDSETDADTGSKPSVAETSASRAPAADPPRRLEMARAGRIFSPLKRNEVHIKPSPELGPKKSGTSSSKKGIHSRYSFLQGRM